MNTNVIRYILYKHTCVVTNKSYVGFSKKSMDCRWKEHTGLALRPTTPAEKLNYFQHAIRFHGADAWTHELLCEGYMVRRDAEELEVQLIEQHGTFAPAGYNATRGGSGVDMDEGTKEKHRRNTKIALADPVVKAKMCAFQKANKNEPEYRKRNSAQQKIAQSRPEVVEKKRAAMQRRAESDWVSSRNKPVAQMTNDGRVVATFQSATAAARATGIPYSTLAACALAGARGEGRNDTRGFWWKYL